MTIGLTTTLFALMLIKNKIALLSITVNELIDNPPHSECSCIASGLAECSKKSTCRLMRYFNKGVYSDLRFKFDGKADVFCSKQLLSFFSKYFRKHLQNPELIVVKISDFPYHTFILLIRLFYQQFNDRATAAEMANYDVDTLLEIFKMTNKFVIPILQEKCEALIPVNENNFT